MPDEPPVRMRPLKSPLADLEAEQIAELVRRHWDDLSERGGTPTRAMLKDVSELIERQALGLLSNPQWDAWRRLLDKFDCAVSLAAHLEFLEHVAATQEPGP